MKILFISQCPPHPIYRDGATLRVHFLLQEFSKQADCYFLSLTDDSSFNYNDLEIAAQVPGESLYYCRPKTFLNFVKLAISPRRFYSPQMAQKVQDAMCTFMPDIIFVEQTFMAQYGIAALEVPKVMSAVDAISLAAFRQSNAQPNFLAKIAWKYVGYQRRSFEKKYYRLFDRVTAVAEEDASILQCVTGQAVSVVSNGVDTEFFSPRRIRCGRKSVVYSGNLSAKMNEEACLYLLREVYPIIHATRPDINLIIAGRSPTKSITDALPSYVTLMEDLSDIRRAFDGAIIAVSPIVHGTGIKNNVMQAMAMGLPVLMTPLIAKPLKVYDGIHGFVEGRGKNFTKRLVSLLKQSELLHEVGARGRELVIENYSWSKVGMDYVRMFESLLAEKRLEKLNS